jgi:hypothetical protein
MAWIRSQNKLRLADAEAFGIDKREDFELKAYVGGLGDYFLMGVFRSEHAAMAELSRITAWVEGGASGVYQVGSGE